MMPERSQDGPWGEFGTEEAYMCYMVPRVGVLAVAKALGTSVDLVRREAFRLGIQTPEERKPKRGQHPVMWDEHTTRTQHAAELASMGYSVELIARKMGLTKDGARKAIMRGRREHD